MNRIHACVCMLSVSIFGLGCTLTPELNEKSVAIINSQEQFEIWDIVVETEQRDKDIVVALKLEMEGRLKWLRSWNKYSCSSRVRERWGSWFVWMFYDSGKLSYPPESHPMARPSKILEECKSIYVHISVPPRDGMGKGAYVSIWDHISESNSERDWNDSERLVLARYDYVEKPDMKGTVRLRVKLFRNSSLKVASSSGKVLSLSAEQCNLANVRLDIDPTREPQWEDF